MSNFTFHRCPWLGVVTVLVAPGFGAATETGPDISPAAAVTAPAPTLRDLQVLLRVRRTLMADDVLAPMNVGVSVRNGVATLWGPLSTNDEVRRAVKEVAAVRGVESVRNELYLAKNARPLPPVFVLPDRMTPDRAAPTDALVSNGGNRGALTAVARTPGNEFAPRTLPPPGMALLMTPIPLDADPEPPTTVTAARAEGVPAAIDRLQKSDARFAQIGVEWHDGTILLRGNATDAAAVMTFARLLSDVPGVQRIVLQKPKDRQP